MAKGDNPLVSLDGSMDWSGGVNSTVVTTVASDSNPNGLKRTQMSWMDNCTVRDGGISQRFGWSKIGTLPLPPALMANLASGGVVYQGSFIYVNETLNYHVIVVSGHVWQVPTDNPAAAVDLSQQFGFFLPATQRVYFCQAEEFLVIQAGDAVTLPLFWDGTKLWQSKGITDPNATTASPPHTNEIPSATAMCYYMGRLWYAQGRNYSAGDIVGGPSGTLAYGFRDAVLCVQENPLCVGGDGFTVPSSAGNIRGIQYASNINSQLGQGILYIGTREEIYSLTVPITRTDWIAASANNQPLQVVALDTNGWVNDRSIVSVNGDLFFQSLEPSIRPMTTAIRNFHQWGNVPISINENRLLQFTDRSLMWAASGIYYDNRLLETALPFQCPVGVAHKAIIPLNFDVVSSFDQIIAGQDAAPVWEGMLEGLDVLELTEADYGGNPRAFATVWSEKTDEIVLWEFSNALRWDEGDHRVVWYFETPAWTFGDELALKKLVGAEVWIDKLVGEVVFHWDYRPDGYVCWTPWIVYKECAQANPPTNAHYPQGNLRESYRQTKTLPTPPVACNPIMARPSNQGHQFQLRLTVKGYCRVRGIFPMAELLEKGTYHDMVACSDSLSLPQSGGGSGNIIPTPPSPIPPPTPPPAPPTPPPTVPVPVNSVLPAITGTVQVGQTLSGSDGTWTNSPTGYAYQWLSNGTPIGGATANTFLLTGTQLGEVITFQVTASNAGGIGSPATSTATSAVAAAINALATNWSARVVTNGGAAPSGATVTAISNFCDALDAASLTAQMIAVNVFAPDSLIAAITPLIKNFGIDPWTNNNFVAGDLTVNGLVGDAATKYLETGVIPDAAFPSADSCGISAYVSVNGAINGWEAGAFGVSQTTTWLGFATNYAASVELFAFTAGAQVAATGLAGFYAMNRISHTDTRSFFANSSNAFAQIGATDATPAGIIPDINTILVFCVKSTAGNPFQFTDHDLSFIAFHQGLSAADSLALYNAVQALRTALGGGMV